MLAVENLAVDYGGYVALSGVSLEVRTGEIVCLMGANGSGKSSLLNAVSGLVRPAAGTVVFEGRSLTDVPTYRRLGLGLAHVLERRRLFPYMTVLENLLLGSYLPAARARRGEALEQVFRTFPELRARRQQLAHTLSGGEQQMVAIARALMSTPRFLMLDEPFLGLSPRLTPPWMALTASGRPRSDETRRVRYSSVSRCSVKMISLRRSPRCGRSSTTLRSARVLSASESNSASGRSRSTRIRLGGGKSS